MIALLTTYLIIAYVLVPGVLFRVFAGFLVKLRLFQLTRTQELTVGVLAAILPLCLGNIFVWTAPIAKHHPFSYLFGSTVEYASDYRLGLSLAVSSDPQKLLDPGPGPKTAYERALQRIWRRQLRFLAWYFFFSSAEGAAFGYLASRYGDWSGKNALYDWMARKILLPNISEWQLLLTDFTWPKKPKRDVIADVLCQEMLYRGKVSDYFLDNNGKLIGLFMSDTERFRRDDFKLGCQDAKANAIGLFDGSDEPSITFTESVDVEQFWKEIPGSNFYIPADKISNLNIHFPSEDPMKDIALHALLDELVKAANVPGTTVSFDAPAQQPDLRQRIPEKRRIQRSRIE